MKTVRMLALLLLCTVPVACRSSGGAASAEVPCTCGEPATDIEGCAHESCLQGERCPDNPDCVCGSLSIPKK